MSRLSAPSLQDAGFVLCIRSPLLYLSRVIDDVREEFRSVSVTFDIENFYLFSSTHTGEIDHWHSKPSFGLNVNCSPGSIKSINSTPSTKLAILFIDPDVVTKWEHVFSLREFLRQFRSVRVLRVSSFMREVGFHLQQDDGEAILPVLE